MGVVYIASLDGVEAVHLQGFFVGWPNPPSPATHLRLLQGSSHVWLARDGEQGPVVGYITALSDGVLSAFIAQLEVLPAYQGQGIGSELVRRMLASLAHLYAVDLVCDPELEPFYARFGGRRGTAMFWRTYPNQAGAAQAAPEES